MGNASSRQYFQTEESNLTLLNLNTGDVNCVGAVVEDTGTAHEDAMTSIEDIPIPMDVDQGSRLGAPYIDSRHPNNNQAEHPVNRSNNKANPIVTGVSLPARVTHHTTSSVPGLFNPEHILAVFDVLREMHHHYRISNASNSAVYPLELFFPASEYYKLVQIGWLDEDDFDWPDAVHILARGRTMFGACDYQAYTLPDARTAPRPMEGERITLQATYCKDICLTAAQGRARARMRGGVQPMTNVAPTRRDYKNEWNMVFDSIVRSMRALEKRFFITEEVEDMIVRARSGTESGIHSQLRKRGREERIYSSEDDKSASSACPVAAQDDHSDARPCKLRKLNDFITDTRADSNLNVHENHPNEENAKASRQSLPQRLLKSSLKRRPDAHCLFGENAGKTEQESGKGERRARFAKVRFMEPPVLYDAAVAREREKSARREEGGSSKKRRREGSNVETSARKRGFRMQRRHISDGTTRTRRQWVAFNSSENQYAVNGEMPICDSVRMEERVIRPLPKRAMVDPAPTPYSTPLRLSTLPSININEGREQSSAREHRCENVAPRDSDGRIVIKRHATRS